MNTETIFRKLVINSLIRSLKGNRSFSHFRSRLSPRTGHTSERVVKVPLYISCRGKKDELSSLFVPVPVKISSNCDDINVGEELSTKLEKGNLQKILNKFFKRAEIKQLSAENGLDAKLFHQAFISFRRFCTESEALPTDLHLILSDILQNSGHVDDIFPFFLRHAKQVFPHLECMEDLKHISDLRSPPNWYPEARALNRKIIFHSGPTNSGKTYHALERFKNAKSGVYCGPLKLLAAEVFSKTNDEGIPCDLVTGEERKYANEDQSKANHVCCTVEMTSLTDKYEVAVIDEIQMIKDYGRGWAWTRALLGICAEEIHLCGEGAAIDLVQELLYNTGEELEVNQYNRLTKLHKENKALEKLDNVQPGDCIVCFNKNDIYSVSRYLENINKECAVIYGGLPPGTKLAQSKKFNDPNDSCKILVATDAIGMGLNLSIKRVIFYSLIKPVMNEKGEREMDYVTTSQALQIAGRAGRYGTQFEEGYVTTMKEDDLKILNEIMSRPVEEITAAGIHPTAEQIELFAYHLPQATLSNLIDIFVTICQVDTTSYFMCNVDDFKFLADMIQHVPLALKTRYIFCCAPINRKMPFVCTLFLKFARQFSCNEPLTLNWLCNNIGWPFSPPETLIDLVHLEAVFDVLDLYLWLSYRFLDLFPDVELVRDMQKELDSIIQMGVKNITQLLKISQLNVVDDAFASKNKKERYKRKLGVDNSKEKMQNDERIEIKLSNSKLSEQLVSQGLLTPRMLSTLQKEWTDKKLSSKPGRPKKKR